jgi:hypothetical protein
MIKLEKLLGRRGSVGEDVGTDTGPHFTGSSTQAGQAEMGRHSEYGKDSKNGKLTLM